MGSERVGITWGERVIRMDEQAVAKAVTRYALRRAARGQKEQPVKTATSDKWIRGWVVTVQAFGTGTEPTGDELTAAADAVAAKVGATGPGSVDCTQTQYRADPHMSVDDGESPDENS